MNTSTLVMLAALAVLFVALHGPPPQSAEPGRRAHPDYRGASVEVAVEQLKSDNTNVCIHSGENR